MSMRRPLSTFCRTTLIIVGAIGYVLVTPVSGRENGSPSDFPPVSRSVLRIARSQDGKTFTDTGEIFLQHAAGADVIRLVDGSLLVMVDYAREKADDKRDREYTIPAVARSKDGGRTWSSLEPIQIHGPGARSIQPRHGDLVALPGGWYRLFFATPAMVRRDGRLTRSTEITTIRTAITRNGIKYKLEPRSHIRLQFREDVHPMAGWIGKRLHLFASEPPHVLHEKDHTISRIQHLLSRDGKRFVRLAPSRVFDVSFIGSVVMTEQGARAYGLAEDGIVSLVTDRGREWKREPGICLKGGWDPAVVKLKDRSYLMIYSRAMEEKSSAPSQMVSVDPDWWFNQYGWMMDEADVDVDDTYTDAEGDGGLDGDTDVKQVIVDEAEREKGKEGVSAQEEFIQREMPLYDWRDWDAVALDGYVPLPDFERKINYLEWYREYAIGHPEENAYDAYASFMPMPGDEPGSKPDWPEYNDMFTARPIEDSIGPWKPEDHPDWEESYQEAKWFLDQYRNASRIADYASTVRIDKENAEDDPDTANLLLGIMLPSLSSHRTMAKATLSAAWRTDENGRVSADKMMDAWETTLRAATHIESGVTLIEDLVAVAERGLVQRSARWALKEGVFSKDELVQALDTLRRFDRSVEDPAQSLRGEHAMALDLTQYLFSPPGPDGQPKINMKRAKMAVDWFSAKEGTLERMAQMGPEDAYATAEALDAHYRELAEQMRIGYPEVRASDIEAYEQKRINTTPLTEALMPALSRIYNLHARSEASRRATQLAYATHIFKTRHGHWPESVGELGGEFGDTLKIDPFTGDYFGYKLTDDGPRIYSLSENGIDDGGIHSSRWHWRITNDAGSDDFVFWPPQASR